MLVASNGSGECGFFDEFCLGITLCAIRVRVRVMINIVYY
jgi:hypothetical protein